MYVCVKVVSDSFTSCNDYTKAVQATTKTEEPNAGVDHDHGDEREQIRYWVAVAAWFRVVWVTTHFINPPGVVVLEDQYAIHKEQKK